MRVGLASVVRHLEIAESHFDRARNEENDDYLNDAVYRANQAYEGSLKEAWRVLIGSDPNKKKTFELERGLKKSGVLTERARNLLQNYREQWRNPSTHDHTLLFGSQDAFLALWSAIAFATVLLDQIITKLSEREANSSVELLAAAAADAGPPNRPLAEHLVDFANTPRAFIRSDGRLRSEAELIGWLSAYTKLTDRSISVETYPKLEAGIQPDLILTRGRERMVVELKRGRGGKAFLGSATAQLLGYLKELQIKEGALIVAPSADFQSMESWVDIYEEGGQTLYRIVVIVPSGFSHF